MFSVGDSFCRVETDREMLRLYVSTRMVTSGESQWLGYCLSFALWFLPYARLPLSQAGYGLWRSEGLTGVSIYTRRGDWEGCRDGCFH